MPIHQIQPTFAGGEIAPTLYGRVDLQKYPTALAKARNGFVHPHGGFSNRAGMRFIASTKFANKRARLIRFEFSTTQAYQIELGDGYARFYKDGAQILKSSPAAWTTGHAYIVGDFVTQSAIKYYCIVAHTSGTFATDLAAAKWVAQSLYEIPAQYAEEDLAFIDFKQSADVIYLFHGDYPAVTLTRTDHDAWTFADYANENGPFMLSNADTALTITPTCPAWTTGHSYTAGQYVTQTAKTYRCLISHTSGTFATDLAAAKWIRSGGLIGDSVTLTVASPGTFDSDHVGALWRILHRMSQQQNQTTMSAAGSTDAMVCGRTWRLLTTGSWTGYITLEKSVDGGKTWLALRTFTGPTNVDTFGDPGEDSCLLRVTVPSNYIGIPENPPPPNFSGSIVINLSSDEFDLVAVAKITAVTSATIATAALQSNTLTLNANATADWAEGSWSDFRGYPAVVSFYQDRLTAACTRSEPQTGWQTRPESFTDFGRSTPLQDDDGISFRLPSRKVNAIRALVALRQILALTSSGDWSVAGSNGIMTPTTVETIPQGERGCAQVAPVVVGNRVIIVSPMSKTIRDLGFDFQSDGYNGDPISVFANHLFQGHTIKEMDYAQEPDSIVWMVRDDGVLLSLTYLREQEVIAWTWHDTDGEVESVSVIPGDDHDEVWLIVNRDGGRFVERLDPRLATKDVQDQFFVDAGLSLDSPKTITGVTAANPVVVTAVAHGFSNGDLVDVAGIVSTDYVDVSGEKIARGMDKRDGDGLIVKRINGARFKVASKTTDTFQLHDEDGNAFNGSDLSAYVSGGEVRKCVSSVSGLDHLEGQQVAILANGAVMPRQTVSSGAVTIDPPASRIHVGLPYRSELQTLRMEIPQRDGTLQGRKVTIGELTVRVADSLGIKYGPIDGSQMDDLIEHPEGGQEGAPADLFSGDCKQSFQGGHEDAGQILIRQDDPLPMTILAVIPRIEPGG